MLLVTGDEAVCRESSELLGAGLSDRRREAEPGPLQRPSPLAGGRPQLIEAGTRHALSDLWRPSRPYDPGRPCEIEVELASSDHAEQYRHRPDVELREPRLLISRGDTWWDAWRGFFHSHVWPE